MKILKRGTVDPSWVGKCYMCQSVVEVQTNEIDEIKTVNYCEGTDDVRFARVKCPVCGQINITVDPIQSAAGKSTMSELR